MGLQLGFGAILAACLAGGSVPAVGDPLEAWADGRPTCRLVLPAGDARTARLARATLNRYLGRSFGVEWPVVAEPSGHGTYVLCGTPENNPWIARVLGSQAADESPDLGDEGFRLRTVEHDGSRFVIVQGRTPRAVKHGCQELVFYRLRASGRRGWIDAPLDVTMTPAMAYRGSYMLPCWSAHDSLDSWKRALLFNSELTLNRNWFWLDGFPVAGHTGEYAGTALASDRNVRELIDLTRAEDMKFLIGGGWFNWHHEKAVGKDYARGRDYYLAYLDAFEDFDGFYIEPTGEGAETAAWEPECDMLIELIRTVHARRPGMEFAVAIGKFNNPEYLRRMSRLDPKRVFWWWCWGDPLRDRATELYPGVLRWHIVAPMMEYHGSMKAPEPAERVLAGIVTSYDPGQGFGNPWEGWGRLGVDHPRDFDPWDVPFFAHQYLYRERCWRPELAEEDFIARLQTRLFDADAPSEAATRYWALSQLTLRANVGNRPTPADLAPLREFMNAVSGRLFTPRTMDTLRRMEKALRELDRLARPADTSPSGGATAPAG